MADTTGPRFKLIRKKRIQIDADDEEVSQLPVNHTQSPEKQIFQFLPSSDNPSSDKTQPHAARPVQNMNEYANPPEGLPIIIREKDLALRQNTMKHFLALNDFGSISEVMKKKQSHHKIIKHAPIEFINNIASISSFKYAQKKNQGKMLVNELWGRKYHKSIMYATGLRKAEFKIKGESLKVASERIKAVGNYYETRHKDQIKKEREFLELLVIPIESTKPNHELRDMLNTKESTTFRRSSVLFGRNSLRRGSMMNSQTQRERMELTEVNQHSPENNQYKKSIFGRHDTFSPFAVSVNLKNIVSQQQNYDTGLLSDRRENTIVDTEASIGSFRSPTEASLQNISSYGSPRVGEGLFFSTKGFNLTKIKEEKEIEVQSPLLKTIREGLFKSKAKENYENMKKEKANEVAKQTPSRLVSKHGRRVTSSQDSEKLVKKKQNLQINVASKTDSRSRLHTVSGEISLGNRPGSSMDNNRLTPRDRPYRVHSISNRKTSSPFERGPDDQIKLSARRTHTQNSLRTEDPRPSTSVSSAYGITRLHTATSTGIVKTDEIERLKKNFLNLMFYCEEVRNDQEIKDSMKETQCIARELFASPREKYLRSAKYSQEKFEKLEKTISNFLTQNKFCSDKDILEGQTNSPSPKRKPVE